MKAQLRMSEAAQLVGVSPSTLRAWESSGLVTPSRQGRNRRFSPSDVKRLQRIAATAEFNAQKIAQARVSPANDRETSETVEAEPEVEAAPEAAAKPPDATEAQSGTPH